MFGISISGIKNSQQHINVTSNNIANANTYGFKKSRAEFGDVYANSVFSNNRTQSGMGVSNTVVSQQFGQGALTGDTGNSLDCAIQGNGFFVLAPQDGSDQLTYTRNGAFQVNKDGYIVTATGEYVQGWNVNPDGSSSSLDLNNTNNIRLPEDAGAPKASENIGIGVNLPADKDPVSVPTIAKPDGSGNYTEEEIRNGFERTTADGSTYKEYYSSFDPKDASTYTCSTSQTIHDSLGRAHTVTYYMIKVGPDGENSTDTVWNVIPFVDGKPADVAQVGDENPVRITVADNTSSVNGANYFGFQMKFNGNGEMIEGSQIPSQISFVNPTASENDPTGAIANSLRHEIFGGPNEEDTSEDRIDPTFEGDNPVYESGNGALYSCLGDGVSRNQVVNIDFEATQYGSTNFTVSDAPWNDGYATGILLGVEIDKDGLIIANFSNGQTQYVAKLAMADFTNVQGLTKVGDTQWMASSLSGEAIAHEANQGSAGQIVSHNLEMSNVDLTNELVELIVAQRNYQANSQALQTQNTVLDSVLSIR